MYRVSVRGYNGTKSYIQLHVFEGGEPEWFAKLGPQTDKGREAGNAFIARQLKR